MTVFAMKISEPDRAAFILRGCRLERQTRPDSAHAMEGIGFNGFRCTSNAPQHCDAHFKSLRVNMGFYAGKTQAEAI
jgi:hypothetical protein